MDATWVYCLSLMVESVRNFEEGVLGLWYDHFECYFALDVEMLVIHKAIKVYHNYRNKIMQNESDCKVAIEVLLGISSESDCKTTIEVLLGISSCPWRACLIFESTKKMFSVATYVMLL